MATSSSAVAATCRRHVVAWAFLLPFYSACGRDDVASWCSPSVARDVAVSFNEGPGKWEQSGQIASLSEVWRSGPEGGFRYPVAIAVSEEGRLAVLDFGAAQVYGFSDVGAYQGAMLPTGTADGPVAITWTEAGELVVFDALAAKVLYLVDMQVIREIPIDSAFLAPVQRAGMTWAGVLPNGTTLLHPLIEPNLDSTDPSRQKTAVLRLNAASMQIDTVIAQEVRTLAPGLTSRLRAPGWPFPLLSVGPRGQVAIGGADAHYRILIQDSLQKPIRHICREVESIPLRSDETGHQGDSLSSLNESLRRVATPDQPVPYGRLILGSGGALWVQRDRPSPTADEVFGRPGARYDVFDSEGRYLGEVRAPDGVSLHAATGETVWGFDSNGGTIELVAYRLGTR